MPLRPNEILIDDDTPNDVLFPVIDGERKSHGYVERDYKQYPVEMFAPPSEIVLIPRSEWSARIKEKEEQKSRLSDIRRTGNKGQPIPALDQNGQGFCWFYSNTGALMLNRAASNQPYVRLSAHAGACKIKNFRDEGGWCGLGAKFIREFGVPSVSFWKEKSMDRSNDNPETWKNALLHRVTEDYVDLTQDVYDQNLTFDMVITLLLSNVACPLDFNHWSHSVCGMDAVEVEPGSFGIRILNSWSDSWSEMGEGVLRGSKAIPNGAVAIRVTGASVA
jgi:hypothetical protein